MTFRHDGSKIFHVGVYMGNGNVIEGFGRDEGVIEPVSYTHLAVYKRQIFKDTANDGILWLGNKAKANTIWVETGLKMSDLRTWYPG